MTPIAVRDRATSVLRDLAAGRRISDQQLQQHARDCARLCEEAYARFEQDHREAIREHAVLWQLRCMSALAAMSDDWKLSRDAEVLASIGAAYFVEQGAGARRSASNDAGGAGA